MRFLFVAACVVFFGAGCVPRTCLKSHQEARHKDAWVQVIPKYAPVYHPSYDYMETVCDEYEAEPTK